MRFVSKISLCAGALFAVACAGKSATTTTAAAPAPMPMNGPAAMARNAPITAPSPDPRVGLRAGLQDAASAIWNLRMVSHTPSPQGFAGVTNSDLGFYQANVIQGNYNGFQIWDISDPAHPRVRVAKLCPASQSDVSVYKNLLFVSAEAPSARLDCGAQAPQEAVSKDRIRGVRIFDITNIDNPKYLANVQSCRGSHTHTVVTDPNDKNNIYIYISGTSGIRPTAELPGCAPDPRDPNTALFNIEVIKIPLAHPEQAAIVSHARIFQTAPDRELVNTAGSHGASPADTGAAGRGGRGGRGNGGNFAAPAPTTFVKPNANGMSGQIAMINAINATSTSADSAAYNKSADSLRAAGFQAAGGGGGFGGRGGGRGGRGGGGAAPAPMTGEDSLRVWSQFALSRVPPLTQTSTSADTARWVKSTDSLRAKGYANIPFPPTPRGTRQRNRTRGWSARHRSARHHQALRRTHASARFLHPPAARRSHRHRRRQWRGQDNLAENPAGRDDTG